MAAVKIDADGKAAAIFKPGAVPSEAAAAWAVSAAAGRRSRSRRSRCAAPDRSGRGRVSGQVGSRWSRHGRRSGEACSVAPRLRARPLSGQACCLPAAPEATASAAKPAASPAAPAATSAASSAKPTLGGVVAENHAAEFGRACVLTGMHPGKNADRKLESVVRDVEATIPRQR